MPVGKLSRPCWQYSLLVWFRSHTIGRNSATSQEGYLRICVLGCRLPAAAPPGANCNRIVLFFLVVSSIASFLPLLYFLKSSSRYWWSEGDSPFSIIFGGSIVSHPVSPICDLTLSIRGGHFRCSYNLRGWCVLVAKSVFYHPHFGFVSTNEPFYTVSCFQAHPNLIFAASQKSNDLKLLIFEMRLIKRGHSSFHAF